MTEATTSFPPRALRIAGGRLLETLLNRAVELDAATRERIATLDGRSVELHLRGPELRLRVTVDDGRLRVGPPGDDASLRVAATPGSLLAMALDRDAQAAPGSVEIAGDAALARQIEKLLGTFEPDFEAVFAARFGDVAGVPLARGLKSVLTGLRRHGRGFVEDGAAWLRDEARLTPARSEVEDFLDAVDAFDARVERLESRLRRLEPKT